MFLTCQASGPTNQHRKYIRAEYQFHCHTGPSVRAAMQSRPRWPASLFVAYYRCSIEKNEKLCGPGPAQPSTRGSHAQAENPNPLCRLGSRGTEAPASRAKKTQGNSMAAFLHAREQPALLLAAQKSGRKAVRWKRSQKLPERRAEEHGIAAGPLEALHNGEHRWRECNRHQKMAAGLQVPPRRFQTAPASANHNIRHVRTQHQRPASSTMP